MKKIFLFPIISLLFLISCSDDDLNLPKNQIGTWEGLRIVHKHKNMITISTDSSEVSIILNSNGSGMFESESIIQWKKEKNEFTNREEIVVKTENSSGTIEVSYPIFLDEPNQQEWGRTEFFPNDSISRDTKWLLNRIE